MTEKKPGGITDEERDAVIKALYQNKPPLAPVPPGPPRRDRRDPVATTRPQYRYGLALVALGCFTLLLYLALPNDTRRGPFIFFAFVTVCVGGVLLDRAKNKHAEMTKLQRLGILIERLQAAPGASSRDAAFALLRVVLNRVEDELSTARGNDYISRMRMSVMTPDISWADMNQDPCYWDDSGAKTYKTSIYRDGTILITDVKSKPPQVILEKGGA